MLIQCNFLGQFAPRVPLPVGFYTAYVASYLVLLLCLLEHGRGPVS